MCCTEPLQRSLLRRKPKHNKVNLKNAINTTKCICKDRNNSLECTNKLKLKLIKDGKAIHSSHLDVGSCNKALTSLKSIGSPKTYPDSLEIKIGSLHCHRIKLIWKTVTSSLPKEIVKTFTLMRMPIKIWIASIHFMIRWTTKMRRKWKWQIERYTRKYTILLRLIMIKRNVSNIYAVRIVHPWMMTWVANHISIACTKSDSVAMTCLKWINNLTMLISLVKFFNNSYSVSSTICKYTTKI